MTTTDHVIRVVPGNAALLARTIEHELDDRWIRAFAASINDTRPEVFDLQQVGGLLAHPVFPVCIEWPLIEHGAPGIELSTDTLRLGLHVSHHIEIHAPLRAGRRVRTVAKPNLAQARTSAALIGTRFRTYSEEGELLVTSDVYTLYPGVRLVGSRRAPEPPYLFARTAKTHLTPIEKFTVGICDAVIYTECARIWNPIHTDIRVARAAGLPDTVLHGTATLARAVTAVSRSEFAPENPSVTQVSCRFTGPVYPGTTLTISATHSDEGPVCFEVRADDGSPAISDGVISFQEML
ncbi:MaoC/PaaZ C-terminal domain-containing protein [Rhodococcus rhodochrous]|uniref:Dehydratase n=1 Tax=Rhodococcus rhodochrous KG-21 TaxID=1441923 RepID=A0A0M8PCK0_RHORH|nr:MaoC/PaaZ C-terminal domain-containing protein [Rhodococcus rhodochrous]KOS53784.1 dehydratase [Rhodococcus rhodochrous KG-21]